MDQITSMYPWTNQQAFINGPINKHISNGPNNKYVSMDQITNMYQWTKQ